jgi:phage terminase small subunit
MKALTALQKRFCDIILLMELAGKVNQQKAYELAGYKCRGKTAKTEASRTLSKPPLKAYLTRARARNRRAVEKTEAEIIAQYEKLGWSELTDFASWDKDGFKLKSSKEIPKDQIAALKSIIIDEQEYTNKKGKKGITRRVKIDLHSPKAALDSLAKIKGMMKPDLKDVVSFAQALHEAMKDEE